MEPYVGLWLFFIYGLLGVIIETAYCSLWVNRGVLDLRMALLYLPFNPLYGCAGVILTFALGGLASWPILVFLAGLTICTTLEYVAAAGLERLFGLVLWDYQDKPLNVRGRICLQSALMWGLLSLLLVYVLDPMLGRMIRDSATGRRYCAGRPGAADRDFHAADGRYLLPARAPCFRAGSDEGARNDWGRRALGRSSDRPPGTGPCSIQDLLAREPHPPLPGRTGIIR